MFENRSFFKVKASSERGFGFTFAIVFIIIGFYPLWHGKNIALWACVIALIFFLFSIFLPKVLIIPNKLWSKLGILLGVITAPIIMALIFFLTVTPIGIIMRLLGKDLLRQKLNKSKKSYWIKRTNSLNSMKNQF